MLFNDKKAWKGLKEKVTEHGFSWEEPAKKYLSLYNEAGKKILTNPPISNGV